MHFQIFVRLKKGCFQFALKNPCFDPIPRMYVHYPKIRFQIPDPSLIEYIRPCCCRRVYFLFFACMMLENEKIGEDDDGSRSRCFCYFCLENDETHIQSSKSSKKCKSSCENFKSRDASASKNVLVISGITDLYPVVSSFLLHDFCSG